MDKGTLVPNCVLFMNAFMVWHYALVRMVWIECVDCWRKAWMEWVFWPDLHNASDVMSNCSIVQTTRRFRFISSSGLLVRIEHCALQMEIWKRTISIELDMESFFWMRVISDKQRQFDLITRWCVCRLFVLLDVDALSHLFINHNSKFNSFWSCSFILSLNIK